ncbi:MAG: TetR/AcrR family transcriptional regulator [Clostridia bacterium]|nr:TetR/AcrR family transcriptional regulator [Clostridia bacterium]
MAETIREPKQKRSIEKKERIIKAGYDLFAEKGYFSTNTAEIAKAAGVSTGIVYGYFHDKRDILLGAMEIYIENVFTPIFSLLSEITSLDFASIIPSVIDYAILVHQNNAAMHTTLHSLSSEDEVVASRFSDLEEEVTKKMSARLFELGYPEKNTYEKVHAAMNVVQSIAHEEIYDRHAYIDYASMRRLVTDMLVNLFEGKE